MENPSLKGRHSAKGLITTLVIEVMIDHKHFEIPPEMLKTGKDINQADNGVSQLNRLRPALKQNNTHPMATTDLPISIKETNELCMSPAISHTISKKLPIFLLLNIQSLGISLNKENATEIECIIN